MRMTVTTFPRIPGRLTATVLVFAGCTAAPALAQNVGFNQNDGRSGLFERRSGLAVFDRPQPEFDPVPIRVGSFGLLSSVGVGVSYLDNVFADESSKRSDAVFSLGGVADLRSNWSRNGLRLLARGNLYRYADTSTENVDLFGIGAAGRFDISNGSSLQAGAQYSRNVVPRTSSRSPVATTRRVTYNEALGFGGAVFGGNQARLIVNGEVRAQRYDQVRPLDPAVTAADFSDRNIYAGRVRGEYAISQSWFVFAEARGNLRRFPDPKLITRRSEGYELLAGANAEFSALLRGEVSLGYIRQNFSSVSFSDYSGLAYHADVEYFPTPLVTVRLTADREIDDAGIVGFGSFVTNTVALRADYELRRNIIISPQVGAGRDRYQGRDLRFKRFFAQVDGRWSLSPRLLATAQLVHQQRNGNDPVLTRDFKVNSATAGLTYRF